MENQTNTQPAEPLSEWVETLQILVGRLERAICARERAILLAEGGMTVETALCVIERAICRQTHAKMIAESKMERRRERARHRA